MGIDFSKFTQDIQAKIKAALEDGKSPNKIDAAEFRAMNLDKQIANQLMKELAGNSEFIGDGYIKAGSKNKTLILLDMPEENSIIPLTQDSLDYYQALYPDKEISKGIYRDGVLYLADSQGKPVKDRFNNYITEKISFQEYVSEKEDISGNFEVIENEPVERTNRRFAVSLINSMYNSIIKELSDILNQMGVLDAGLWREALGMGVQAIADLKKDQELITATTQKKIERIVKERDDITGSLNELLDSPADFEAKFYQLTGMDYRNGAFEELREIQHNQENKKPETKYKECVSRFKELYPDNKVLESIESWADSADYQTVVDKTADIVIMLIMTTGIGKLFQGSVQKIAKNILVAAAKGDKKAVMSNFAKLAPEVQTIWKSLAKKEFGVAAAQVTAPILQSSATMGTWEGAKAFLNGLTNGEDLTPEQLLERTLQGIVSGAEMGAIMGGLETFAIAPAMAKLTPFLNKFSGASSEISALLEKGDGVVSMEKIMETYTKASEALRGKIVKEGAHAVVALPVFTVGFTTTDTAFHYDENEFRKSLLDAAVTDEEREAINKMSSVDLRIEFAKKDFIEQVKGMATIEGVGLIFRRIQAGRIAAQALPKSNVPDIIDANLRTVKENGKTYYEIASPSGKSLSVNDGGKVLTRFSSIEEAAAAYSALCIQVYSELSVPEESENPKSDNQNSEALPTEQNLTKKEFNAALKELNALCKKFKQDYGELVKKLTPQDVLRISDRGLKNLNDIEKIINLSKMDDVEYNNYVENNYQEFLSYISQNEDVNRVLKAFGAKNDFQSSKVVEEIVLRQLSIHSENKEETLDFLIQLAKDSGLNAEEFGRKLQAPYWIELYTKAYNYAKTIADGEYRIVIAHPDFIDLYNNSAIKNGNYDVITFDYKGDFVRRVKAQNSDNSIQESVTTPDTKHLFRAEYAQDAETNRKIILNSRKEVYDKQGNILYTEFYEQSEGVDNKYDIYREFPNGKKYKIGIAERSLSGDINIEKTLEHADGSKTDYNYVESPDGSRLAFVQITDKDGNVTLRNRFQYKVIDENHFKTIENGVEYNIEYQEDKVVVTRSDGKKVTVDIGKNSISRIPAFSRIFSGALSKDLLPLLKKMPGSFYFDINEFKLNKIGVELDNVEEGNAHYRNGKNIITLSNDAVEAMFTLGHEFGHYLFKSLKLADNKTITKTYLQERKAATVKLKSNFEAQEMDYLISNKSEKTDSYEGSLEEMAADIHAFLYSSNYDPRIEMRGQFLQEYYPETFAAISKAFLEHIPHAEDTRFQGTVERLSTVKTQSKELVLIDGRYNKQPTRYTELGNKIFELKPKNDDAEVEYNVDEQKVAEIKAQISEYRKTEPQKADELQIILEMFTNPTEVSKITDKQIDAVVNYLNDHYDILENYMTKQADEIGISDEKIGKFGHRIKGEWSTRDKIVNFIEDAKRDEIEKGKPQNPLTLLDAFNDVRDKYASRTVFKKGDFTKHPDVAAILEEGNYTAEAYKKAILRAAELQSEPVRLKLLEAMRRAKEEGKDLAAVRITNYTSEGGIPIFSPDQMERLKLDGAKMGVNVEFIRLAREIDPTAKTEFVDGASTKKQPSGYTALQVNFQTKTGEVIEWQYRGELVNEFAEAEHLPYDIRTGKHPWRQYPELEALYKPIAELLDKDNMPKHAYKQLNKYFTDYYKHLRKLELGFESQEPRLEDYEHYKAKDDNGVEREYTFRFDKRLEAKNLMKLHYYAEGIKDGTIIPERAVEEFNAEVNKAIQAQEQALSGSSIKTNEKSETSIGKKLQSAVNVSDLMPLFKTMQNDWHNGFRLDKYGNISFYDSTSKTQYNIKFDGQGNIVKFSKQDYKSEKNEVTFYIYDKSGKQTQVSQDEYHNVQETIRTNKLRNYIITNPDLLPEETRNLLLQDNNHYYTKEDVYELSSMLNTAEDIVIVNKLLDTRGNENRAIRAIGDALKLSQQKFGLRDIIKVLKHEKARAYVLDKITHNKYVKKTELKQFLDGETFSALVQHSFTDEIDTSYRTKEITLNNISDVLKEYQTNLQIREQLNAEIPDGEAACINGKMYCRAGNTLVPIQLDKAAFDRLFPVEERFNIKQGRLGDCYFIAELGGYAATPNGRAALYSSFRQEGNDIIIKFPRFENIEIKFENGKLNKLLYRSIYKIHNQWTIGSGNAHVKACDGIKMIEQAFSFVRNNYTDDKVQIVANDKFLMNKQMQELEGSRLGGGAGEAPSLFSNYECLTSYTSIGFILDGAKTVEEGLTVLAKELETNTNVFGSVSFQNDISLDVDEGIISNHQYRIVGFDRNKQIVKMVNPHDSSIYMELPLEIFKAAKPNFSVFKINVPKQT